MPLLPPELWLEIFACADSLTLASVTRVNSTYKRLAESSLYRNVSLSSEKDGIERFAQSLAACPSHAALVQHLDIVAINLHEATISIHAYGILKRCRELRSITITIVAEAVTVRGIAEFFKWRKCNYQGYEVDISIWNEKRKIEE